ncbi:UDP-glucose 4-epimerase GalE [Brevibacterium samyangense]|uniref:UDP-glucose 4-epimerase n=1 Tax=Brevibacterium samyangense TaxID=366888 RepID=A0ABP5F220_9MICO
MSVLVTGGAGYIGSHVVRLLQERGEDVVVVDDLSNGKPERVGNAVLETFDLSDADATVKLGALMLKHEVDAVIHFAALKQIGESMERPLWYYKANVEGMRHLIGAMQDAGVKTMVFSSSAGTYGQPDVDMITEKTPCQPINPYGQTKLIGEWMLDNAARFGMNSIKLRYFNVAGAGAPELRDTAMMNLVPIVYNRLLAGQDVVINGDDYPTPDGTCVRDYVHVVDLAEAHLVALDRLRGIRSGTAEPLAQTVFNAGNGIGYSVREVIDAISPVIGRTLDPVVGPRREGDPPRLVADASAITEVLGWKASRTLEDMVRSACPPELLAGHRGEKDGDVEQ